MRHVALANTVETPNVAAVPIEAAPVPMYIVAIADAQIDPKRRDPCKYSLRPASSQAGSKHGPRNTIAAAPALKPTVFNMDPPDPTFEFPPASQIVPWPTHSDTVLRSHPRTTLPFCESVNDASLSSTLYA